MANKFPAGPFKIPDARKLAAREMSVDTYFSQLHKTMQANQGGSNLTHAKLVNLLRGAWSEFPTLDQLLDRLTPQQLATIDALKEAVRAALYPEGDAQLHHSLLQKFWNRNQLLIEIPPGSGEYYPEPALTYTESKRHLVSQLPVAQQPPEAQIINSLIFGLQPILRQAVNLVRPKPQTVDEAVAAILEQERSISEPASHSAQVANSFTTTTHAVPGLRIHPPMANPPLELFGKVSGASSALAQHATVHNSSTATTTIMQPTTTQLAHTTRNEMEQFKQDMTRRLDDLHTTINATITTQLERRPHYGPAERKPVCDECSGNHPTSECFGKCKWCKRYNHPHWRCFYRPGNRGGRGNGRGGFFNGAGRGGGRGNNSGNNSNKRGIDDMSDVDVQSIADQVAKRLKGEA